MASPENILLYLPEKEEQQVKEVFARLEDQGFPTQNQKPHITITFSASMPNEVVRRAAKLLPHLTMGLRLPREIVPDYIRALDEVTSPHFKEITATQAAYWRPKIQQLTVFEN
ncbi:MAG: hypothetical protein Q4F10_11330 [Corynebacterium glutamicum]|uniref:hypothetical protein n=1 Tax=Corynebacterium glutamicum TaxID=1718 RepID=UPI0009862C32|nr:hypothetical protein [Corynebacterium glutamicum]MDO5374036.1 hypothetical protein [Corynebacterium glutamicum]